MHSGDASWTAMEPGSASGAASSTLVRKLPVGSMPKDFSKHVLQRRWDSMPPTSVPPTRWAPNDQPPTPQHQSLVAKRGADRALEPSPSAAQVKVLHSMTWRKPASMALHSSVTPAAAAF